MMKKYFAMAAVATMFAACTNDDIPQADSLKDTPITLKTNVAELTASRTITEAGELVSAELGLFVTTTNTNPKYTATNMKWTGDADGNWTSTDGTLLYEGANKQTAYAYSPYEASYDEGAITIDLTKQTDYLYASSTTLTSSELQLNMSHRLSKATVNIAKRGTEIATDDAVESISFTNVPVSATWKLADNTITNGSTGTIPTDDSYTALLLPGTTSITVHVAMESNRVFKAVVSAPDGGLVAGTAYTINLVLGHDAATIGEVKVTPWATLNIDGGVAEDITPVIDGTLGGKATATEDDVNALVEKLKGYVDNGLTTITVPGSNPATYNILGSDIPAVSAAIFFLGSSGSTTNGDPNSPYCGTIDLILPDVTEIVDYEFDNAYALKSITLPKVTTVGDGAFYGCLYLQTITFGSVVTAINQNERVVFHMVGKNVGGCDLVLNCGQMNSTYIPDLTANTWYDTNNKFKRITLTHTGECGH